MARGRRRKCKCCLKLFRPDPCNRRHQRYCSAPRCRRASKTASQARWLARAENHDYFRAGSPGRRTTTTSADPCISPAARPGGRVIPAIGARRRAARLRLKMSLRHKLLTLLAKRVFSRAHRYKIS
jgi:hypothetical protein